LGHVSSVEREIRVSPFDFPTYEAQLVLGTAALQEGRYEDAASHYASAVRSNPQNSANYFLQAIALALAGRFEEGSRVARRRLELEPGFRYRRFFEFTTPQIADTVARGARQLGLVKCPAAFRCSLRVNLTHPPRRRE
jgi:adenylate cyclase